MRALTLTLTLALVFSVTSHAVPKTVEGLCGALLLVRPTGAITDQGEIGRYLVQLAHEGSLDPGRAAKITRELNQPGTVSLAFAIKGDDAIKAYLNDFGGALGEFNDLGRGAYRNLIPAKGRLGLDTTKGGSALLLGQIAAAQLPGAVGASLSVVSLLYLLKQIASAGLNWTRYYSKLGDLLDHHATTEVVLNDLRRVLAEDRGLTSDYSVRAPVDHDYVQALIQAKGPEELPIGAFGQALLRRRTLHRSQADRFAADLIFFQDYEDGRNVLLAIARLQPLPAGDRGYRRWLNVLTRSVPQ